MKKYHLYALLAATSLFTISLNGQQIQSYTNANLPPAVTTVGGNSSPSPTPSPSSTNNSIPGLNINATANTPNKYPPLSPDQLQQIQSQMYAQIQVAEQRVQNLMANVQDHTRMPMSIDKVALEQAIIELDVKKTLVGKFLNSPSLKSPKVQQVLMGILSKTGVSAADLANLQSVVDSERPYTY